MSNLASLLKVAFYNTTGINSLSKNIKEDKEKKDKEKEQQKRRMNTTKRR